jgi:hypothetical protein
MTWHRANLKSVICYFCRGKKSKLILENGMNSLQQEFDVVKHVKLMKQVKAMIHVIFTRRERALLRYNRHLLLKPEHESSEDSDPYNELQFAKEVSAETPQFRKNNPYFARLLALTKKHRKA